MLRHRVVLLVLSCAAGAALAQSPPATPAAPPAWHGRAGHAWVQRREMMEKRRMERLAVLLDLTPAQQQKVRAIMAGERASMRPSVQQMMQAMRQLHAAHQAARKDAMQKFAAVLSPAQMKKLRLLMPEHRRFMMMRGGMGMHMGMGMGMGMMGPRPMGPPGPPMPPAPPGPKPN